MLLPYLSEVQKASKKYDVTFRGINYGEGSVDGEFVETCNISTDQYPCLAPRAERIKEGHYTSPTTLHAKGHLLVIDGTKVLYNDVEIGTVSEGKKQTATIGNYIVIFPDKVYYNVEDDIFGSMEETYSAEQAKIYRTYRPVFTANTITSTTGADFDFNDGDTVEITGCSYEENNRVATIKTVSGKVLTFDLDDPFTECTEPAGKEITIALYGENICEIEFTDSTITTTGKDFNFREGDAVSITGSSISENNKELIVRAVSEKVLTFDENNFTEGKESNNITIKRSVPDLDFICESNYRLWGTHGNTIYASKFSDPFNFKVFDGLSSDSYYIEVGSEGDFTGCIPYSSHICFFKENTLHKLYGTKPSNFQINTVNVYGVQSGSERSMQIVNEQLLYKGVGGVYAYTGGVPELISEKFGNQRYSNAVACCDGEKYYISMKQGNKWHLFTYDVYKNIWLREDDTEAVDMAFFGGNVYYIDAKGGLYCIDKAASKNNVEWSATFCTMHETMNERKGYSKFHLRMSLAAGAWVAVDVKTDNEPTWRQVYITHNSKAKTFSVPPIIPTRCDSIDIRLRGKGDCTVRTFIREFTVGSDV